MGNDQSHSQADTFDNRNWELVSTQEEYAVWRNRTDPSQNILEHTIYSSSDAEQTDQKQMFLLRKNHPRLVAARYLVDESSGQFCSSSHTQKLFIEKIPVRLSDIEHIPFPDCLHVYNQCLQGFHELSRHVGFFLIEEEYIGINQRGVVKAWMNNNYFKNYSMGTKISEEAMVKNIIETIEKNLDHNQYPKPIPSIRNYLYRNNDRLSFEEANKQFSTFLSNYCNGKIPSRLECIDRVGGLDAIIVHRSSEQLPLEKDSVSAISQSPYHSTYEVENQNAGQNYNRPQLVDSQFLKNQFPITTPRIEKSPVYYQVPRERLREANNGKMEPITQKNILPPNLIREHTPIVRKTTSNHNYPDTIVPIQPISEYQPGPFVYNQPKNNQIGPNNQIRYRVNERPESKSFGSKAGPMFYRQQQVPAPVTTSKQLNHSQINQQLVGKTSLIQLVQPETPKYPRQAMRSNGFPEQNPGFIKEALPLNQIQAVPQTQSQMPQPSPRSFLFERPSSKSLNARTEKRLNSVVIAPNQLNNPYGQGPSISQQNTVKIIQNNAFYNQNTLYSVQNSAIPLYQSSNEPTHQRISSKLSNEEVSYPANNTTVSQYTTVDIDDGKSSSDFLKKLKQLNTFDNNINSASRQTLPTYKNSFSNEERFQYVMPKHDGFGRSGLTKEANSLQNLNQSEDAISNQQFGRNAVSNIISNQSGINISSQKNTNSTPLKFQKNLDMKYSMFKPDEPPSPTQMPSYAFKPYEPNFDEDILADMNRLRS